MSFWSSASKNKKKGTGKGKGVRDRSPAYGSPEESSEEKARLIKLNERLKEIEEENQRLKEDLKQEKNKNRVSKQESAELKAQPQEAKKKEDTNKITDSAVSSSPVPKMTLAQSFTEHRSDEVRDSITDICSYCASKGNLRPATHFCLDCGVYGRYICGECLQSHNMFVYDHVAETIAMQSKNRRKQLQNDLAAEKRKTESTAKELAGAFQELQIHKEKREKLQTDLLTERLKSESIAKELAGALKELKSHKEKRTKETEIQIAKYEVELKRKEAECQEKMNKDVKRKIAENEEETKRKIWRIEEEKKRKEAEYQERMQDGMKRLRGQLQIEIEAKEKALRRIKESERQISTYEVELKRKEAECQEKTNETEIQIAKYEVELKRKEAECQEKINQCLKSKITDYEEETKRKIWGYEEELRKKKAGYQESQKRMQVENERLCSQLQMEIGAKEDAQRRLSSVASSKLRDKNPYITDLSDQNRPTRIAEKISELYDNQWTEAYFALKGEMNDRQIIQTLLDALMRVSDECRRLSEENFFERVQRSIESPIEATGIPKTRLLLSDQLKQQIKEFRKIRAAAVVKDIEKIIKPKIKLANHPATYVQVYLSHCVEICWLCAVQDPPLILKAQSPLEFDTSTFKDYEKRGKYVEFVVWPALYLNETGPLLAKGVAQGTGNKTLSTRDNAEF